MNIFVTGATGLLGRKTVSRLLAEPSVPRIYLLARPETRVADIGSGWPCEVIRGDLRDPGLGLAGHDRAQLARRVTTVIHLAANTSFSQTLDEARATNRDGTVNLLDLCSEWPSVTRFVYVSTAFVAGLRTGRIDEAPDSTGSGWANAYEQSKAEAESAVRASRQDWTIVRPATVACDDASGRITQVNAVHRALRLYFGGLAAMLPSTEHSAVDVVTADYAADGIARLARARDVERMAFHLCAGSGAMPLGELLDVTYDAFLRSSAWRRKGIVRPVRTDMATYRLFERAAHDAGSDRVRQALKSLSHFVPQLAFPKTFSTARADELLGGSARPVASFWTKMVDHLVDDHRARQAA
jgi:nucleoside-diphosphate-sugar epimerase